LEEKIREAIRPLATNYVLGYISNLKQFDAELKLQIDKVADQILALGLPEGKPPLLEEHNCHQVDNPFDYNMGAQAQWNKWNEWYEAIKGQ